MMNYVLVNRFRVDRIRSFLPVPRACALMVCLMLCMAAQAAAQCSQWTPEGAFNLNSPDAQVNDMLTFDLDGGGPQPARLIAATDDGVWVWDTVNWRPLGEGLAEVNALTIFNGSLVAGAYYSAPHVGVVVRWNGNGWVQMGQPLGEVRAFAVYQGVFYAAGQLDALGAGAIDVARWDGTTWSAAGIGFGGGVSAMIVFDPDGGGPELPLLVAGGYTEFTSPSLYYQLHMVVYDGSVWRLAASDSLACGALDFIEFNGDLYACGVRLPFVLQGQGFKYAVLAKVMISPFNLSSFALEEITETDSTAECFMSKVTEWNGNLVVVGKFNYAGSDNVMLFDGTDALPLVGGRPGSALNAACVFGLNIAVAGALDEVAQCNGVNWVPVNSSGFGNAFATLGSRLVVGGNFNRDIVESGVPRQAYNLVGWNGSSYSRVGGGTNGVVHALEGFVSGSDQLVVGGSFTRVDEGFSTVSVNNIALRTEPLLIAGSWSPMGSGFNNRVLAVDRVAANQIIDEAIYAGGEFTAAGTGSPAFSRIAQWFGSPASWSAMGTGFNGTVRAIKAYNSGATGRFVIAGGDFTSAGGVTVNRIASWAVPALPPGPAWAAMGNGFNGPVYAIERFGGSTYAAGAFTFSGGTPVNRIARWTGTAWVPVGNGTGFNNTVRALLVDGSFLYAAGDFTSVDGHPADRLARWDGSTWADAGSDSAAAVLALATFRGELHAGLASDDTSLRRLAATPWLAQHPQSQSIACGQNVTFTVAPGPGYTGLSLSWRKDGVPLAPGPTGHGSSIAFNQNSLIITSVRALDAGAYTCVLSSASCSSVTSGTATLSVTGACASCPADINADGAVNVDDLIAVILGWGCTNPPGSCPADVNASGAVDVDDLIAVILAWGACP